ncbi:MAG: metal-dependent hydrolase [Acidobacteriota bacterium]
MALDITFLGQSGFLFDDGSQKMAIDPFLTDNPVAKHRAEDVVCQTIGLTHAHFDHMADALGIAQANNANIVAAFEICNYMQELGHENVNPGNAGGKIATEFGWVAFTQAFHSSSFDGRYMGMPNGLVVNIGGKTIYHLGDTGLFSDLKLLGEIYKPDIVCVPIGDRFTMGPELGTMAAEMVGAPIAVPMHYNTWPPIEQNVEDFAPQGIEVKVLEPGETWSVD